MGNNSAPVTLHKYLYANANPVNMIDPSGQFSLVEFGVVNSIVSELSSLQVNVGISLLDAAFTENEGADTYNSFGVAILALGGSGFKLLKMLSQKGRKFLESKGLLNCKSSCVSKLKSKDFEGYLTKLVGGKGSFSKGGRDFDGGVGNNWWEAKSGRYWRDHTNTEKGLAKFRSDMGDRKRIADDHGATYELFSNSPIPQKAKNYLDKKGIKYTEILD